MNRPSTRQAYWALLGALAFATMGVCVKFASTHYSNFEIVMYRGMIGAVFMAVWMRQTRTSAKTQVPLMHLWRSMVGVSALLCWFYALAYIPLATGMTLNYMSSVWLGVILLSAGWLFQTQRAHAKRQLPLMLTIVMGFVGVALLLRPTFQGEHAFAALVGLCSGIGAAFAYLQVGALTKIGEPESRVVFYFSIGGMVAGAMGALWTGFHGWHVTALWIVPVGVLATLGQWCITKAYGSGATLLVANLQYAGIAFAALYGVVIFQDQMPWFSWLGMAIIVVSGMLASVLRARALPEPAPQEVDT
jgi:S-adenosylmethionine uptake transporter